MELGVIPMVIQVFPYLGDIGLQHGNISLNVKDCHFEFLVFFPVLFCMTIKGFFHHIESFYYRIELFLHIFQDNLQFIRSHFSPLFLVPPN